MKSRSLLTNSSLGLLALLAMPVQTVAQEQLDAHHPAHYSVKDLGTLGGTYSFGYQINEAGWVAGGSATATQTGGLYQTAFLWYGDGPLVNLGTLDGPEKCPSCNSEADGPNRFGETVVGSEVSALDPNGEDFCDYGTHRQCLGAIWKNGKLRALPNLPAGHNANALNLNDKGQVVGFAETDITDLTCSTGTPFQVRRFEVVIWEPNGEIRKLRPLAGDTVAFATGINEKGQVVGTSGLCSAVGLPPLYANGPHAVLWENDGTPIDLGSLGGPTTNAGTSINNRGEVVGGSQSAKDGNLHTFFWTRDTGMQDIGTLPGAVVTIAGCCNTLNNSGQVVGASIDGTTFNSTAFFWEKGVIYDLNTLISKSSPWYLQSADGINDAGQITGWGLIDGNVHAFVATPCDRDRRDRDCGRD
jgi:probable HAF family extracellular repeat protein